MPRTRTVGSNLKVRKRGSWEKKDEVWSLDVQKSAHPEPCPVNRLPVPQGSDCPGSCADLPGSNGLIERQSRHNCLTNGHCIRKKKSAIWKKKENGHIFCIIYIK